ncbi:MAG: hypothetical protein Q3M24_04685 [Candidatus Electrothrix aestuarii]|uniref:Uncharacterized protein n=1 Tax=Candidatus Electrothrix aestuarii TaxID=3062594 RepID=A0AAU8LYV5_9BACT|nr:hypothetical protein [Candidatus Electrothrix aestuarii]
MSKSKKSGHQKVYLKDRKINELFDKYSFPLVKACITPSQKEKAIGISKILWLLLVKGADTEENIYKVLEQILHDHDKVIGFGATYFHSMKKALSKKDIKRLKFHYSDSENFKSLKDWGDITFLKFSH